jgi:type IV pilus assembly protein PilA
VSLRRFARLSILSNGSRLQRGFSLVELVIAVAVIGLLTAVAVPSYGNFQHSARQQALQEQVKRAHDAAVVTLEDGRGSLAIAGVVDGMNRQSELMLLSYHGNSQDDLCIVGVWKDSSLRVTPTQRGAGCEPIATKPPTAEPTATTPPKVEPTATPTTAPPATAAPSPTPTVAPPIASPAPAPQLPIEGSGTATRGNLTVSAKNEDKWPRWAHGQQPEAYRCVDSFLARSAR